MTPFERADDGVLAAEFTPLESGIITDLAVQIAELLGELGADAAHPDDVFASIGIGGTDRLHRDPAIARLLPDAYGEDADASGDFRRMTEQSLATRKVGNARTVVDSLARGDGQVELIDEEAHAWMKCLSDIRLTLATRLGIEEDGDTGATDSDVALAMHDLYDWLAYVTETLIDALES
ncbi:MAG: hypothetical protein JWM51_1955 [Microbacteriaceae bacterium]|nr:hypothetical protein [Microbacteriaceae bacterium]